MSDKNTKNVYDDGNIPEVDLPQNSTKNVASPENNVTPLPDYAEPLPESFRPRKDGPSGE